MNRGSALLALFLVLGCATAQSPASSPAPAAAAAPATSDDPCAGVARVELCTELIALRERDQEARRRWLADRSNPALQKAVDDVDAQTIVRLDEIVDAGGWPGSSIVGVKGSGAAWTIVQHADPPVIKRYLPMMEKAVNAGELEGALYATSVDRVRVSEGQPQIYGTQFQEVDGKMIPHPIENEAEVDARRAKVGLQPLAEYAALINQVYARGKP